jgi:hypothetical protein
MLRKGLPVQLVAKLHNSSANMIERFYGAHIADALGELARSAIIDFAPAPVTPIATIVRGGS